MSRGRRRAGARPTPAARNQLRIIAGQWSGRRLAFPPVAGLRPTADRVRETLFNWLQPVIQGARCLDLFAGSGALGLEALSRGAAEVLFVERDPRVGDALRGHLRTLGADGGEVVVADALRYLATAPRPFDVVFLDPPFRQGLLAPALEALADGWLAPGARIYLEAEKEGELPPLPPGWGLVRSKRSGQVAYHLAMEADGQGEA